MTIIENIMNSDRKPKPAAAPKAPGDDCSCTAEAVIRAEVFPPPPRSSKISE